MILYPLTVGEERFRWWLSRAVMAVSVALIVALVVVGWRLAEVG